MITFKETKEIYRYKDGIYVHVRDIEMESAILHKEGEGLSMSEIRERVHKIKLKTLSSLNNKPPSNLICLNNCILNTDTFEILPHDEKYIFLNRIPVDYKPELDFEREFNFLKEIADDDASLLAEFFGYCLIADNRYQKALILHGSKGNNGKSTLMKIITAFFGGKDNISSVTIQDLSHHRFMLYNLVGKWINIYADLPTTDITDDSNVKNIISGDNITVEQKNKQPFTYTPFCKLFFSCNNFPKVLNASNAFYRRWIIVKFNHEFSNKGKLEDEYSTPDSRSRWLNLFLHYLKILKERGRFDYVDAVTQKIWEDEVKNIASNQRNLK